MSTRWRRTAAIVALILAVATSVLFVLVPEFAGAMAVTLAWLGTVAAFLILNLEKSERAFGRLASLLSWAGAGIDRFAVAAEVQGTLNGARKEVGDEFSELMPLPAKVRFLKGEADFTTLRDGQVVVAMQPSREHAANVAWATLAYVAKGAIAPARPYVAPKALASIDFSVAKRLLTAGDAVALDYLISQLWSPAVRDDPELADLCQKVEAIEQQGLLARVLLIEFLELGRRLYGMFPPEGIHAATLHFVDRLHRLATKGRDQELGPDLLFREGDLKIGVVLVGEADLVTRLGAAPYIRRALANAAAGCHSVYFLARGRRIPTAEAIASQLGSHGKVVDVRVSRYVVRGREDYVGAICVRVIFEQPFRVAAEGAATGRPRWRRGARRQRLVRR